MHFVYPVREEGISVYKIITGKLGQYLQKMFLLPLLSTIFTGISSGLENSFWLLPIQILLALKAL